MAVLYIREAGAVVKKLGERIIVSKGNETLLDYPVLRVDNLSLFGNVQITTQALHMLLLRGIDVSYFSRNGIYLGHTRAETSGNIFLRLEQYREFQNDTRKLEFARTIVANKMENQLSLIKSHRWTADRDGDEEVYPWKADADSIDRLLASVKEKKTTNELRGLEGMASQIYFRAFSHMVKGEMRFHGRNRRPPRDPVNALLSLTYAFLTKEISTSLEAEGMELHLGFLHGIRYGRKSLSLDLIEEFRQPAADRLVLLLINKRMLTEEDFEENEESGVTLGKEGFRKFCAQYERWMDGRNSVSGEQSFRGRIRKQIGLFRCSICEGTVYQPYSWNNRIDFGEESCT